MAKRLHIDAIQTAPPGKVTPPDQARSVSIFAAPSTVAVVAQTRFQVVLYYNPAGPDESPLTVAARVKESLSTALPERPVLSGRLRKKEEEAAGGGRWEVKFNDAGVRLVQATAEVTMADVIESKEAHQLHAHLAYWEDLNMDRPDFSALFYIQVTQFEGDGYSIGVSCSLLLADPSFLTKFLISWAEIHTQMLTPPALLESSMFHLSYFQRRPDRPNRLRSIELSLSDDDSNRHPNATMLFELRQRDSSPSYDAMAIACLREATARLKARPVSEFVLIVSDHVGDLTVKTLQLASEYSSSTTTTVVELSDHVAYDVAWWDQLGMQELTLVPGNKPVHVSSQIVFDGKDGLVVVMIPESDARLMISVTLPNNSSV
ncbi:protein ECERIFERUM 26-like [Curcuma longa]|uniref:protein ECERIFERUM 26-like n=1 Tax=Curcuma longa TaxID=136217 RepID=UPI003D9EE200